MEFPEGKRFAFSILDDTDDSTVENARPIYDLLHELGFRTTKTVWAADCPEGSELFFAGQTLQNRDYLNFVHNLKSQDFELAWHCATMESSKRARTIKALEFFQKEFGYYPKLHCNHGHNLENIYWGTRRYRNPLFRLLVRAVSKQLDQFAGEDESSPYFWGDLCKQHFRFVRNFTFSELNMLKCDPHMPYHLGDRPYVNYWFSTTDVPDVTRFNQLLTKNKLDRLSNEGGVCILSTHLGKGFVRNGEVDKGVRSTLEYLAKLDGWFVPVSDILELLLGKYSNGRISRLGQLGMEWRHLLDHARQRIK